MKLYLRTPTYINHSDLRFAAAPFQTFLSQIHSQIPAAEFGSCLPGNAGKEPGRAHRCLLSAAFGCPVTQLALTTLQETGSTILKGLELYLDTVGNIRGI